MKAFTKHMQSTYMSKYIQPIETKIRDYQHFIELSHDFDQRWNTTTRWCSITMNDINQKILKEDTWWDVDYNIRKWEKVFDIKSNFRHDDLDIPQGPLGKMNSIWLMLNDIKNGQDFYSPICMSLFQNGNKPIHPGGTRMILADVYTDPVHLCVTDYNNNLETEYPDITWYTVDDYYFDFSHLHELYEDTTTDGNCRTYTQEALGERIRIKQICTYMMPTTDTFNYHAPRTAETPRYFKLENDIISINDMPLAKKTDGIWNIVLDKM